MEKKKYTDEELKQYIDSYLTNRYIELFKNLILDYEPNEIIPSDSFSDLIKYKYNMSTFELSSIKKMVNAEIANDSQKGIYFKLKSLKDYVNEKNRSLQQSISLIEKYHETIGSDHKVTLFHIHITSIFPLISVPQPTIMLSQIFCVNFTPMFPAVSLLCFHPFHKHVSTYFTQCFHLETRCETKMRFSLAV